MEVRRKGSWVWLPARSCLTLPAPLPPLPQGLLVTQCLEGRPILPPERRGCHTAPPAELSDCHAVQSDWRQHLIMCRWSMSWGRGMSQGQGPV